MFSVYASWIVAKMQPIFGGNSPDCVFNGEYPSTLTEHCKLVLISTRRPVCAWIDKKEVCLSAKPTRFKKFKYKTTAMIKNTDIETDLCFAQLSIQGSKQCSEQSKPRKTERIIVT